MRTILCCALLYAGAVAAADEASEPRIEAGIGGLAMTLPDYRGSDRYGSRVLPIPYLAYRSDRVQLTREGLRARLLSFDRLTASLSAAASLPGSEDNPERAGMPQLDPTVEMGPSLDYMLHERDDESLKLKFRLPARAVVAADGLELRDVGWVVVPHLRLDHVVTLGEWEWFQLGSLGAVWASEDYHEYFYGVAPAYARGARVRDRAAPGLRRAWRLQRRPAYVLDHDPARPLAPGAVRVLRRARRRGLRRQPARAHRPCADGRCVRDVPAVCERHRRAARRRSAVRIN
jgi:MipA family protein